MKASFSGYNYVDSDFRIRQILASSDYNYEEKDSVPSRDSLTFTNGYYVYCSAMFIDMRGSIVISEKYNRPTLARIYRSYISELVALIRGNASVCEVNIEGDCVWGIFDTIKKINIDELFGDSARCVSLLNILNWRLSKKGIDPINVGIGLDYGRALMIKAGYSGSGINDVVWMGDVVGSAAKLCSYGAQTSSDHPVMVSSIVHKNLNGHNRNLLSWNNLRGCYHANIINTKMENWLTDQ